jgi:hypothetical protein
MNEAHLCQFTVGMQSEKLETMHLIKGERVLTRGILCGLTSTIFKSILYLSVKKKLNKPVQQEARALAGLNITGHKQNAVGSVAFSITFPRLFRLSYLHPLFLFLRIALCFLPSFVSLRKLKLPEHLLNDLSTSRCPSTVADCLPLSSPPIQKSWYVFAVT